nr:chaperone modulator CbpM [Dissulfurirhabdus thermomarina]
MKIACREVGLSPGFVRCCIREGLVEVRRVGGRCLLDEAALRRLHRIRRLRKDLGVNLAGIDIILRLLDRLEGDPRPGGGGRARPLEVRRVRVLEDD